MMRMGNLRRPLALGIGLISFALCSVASRSIAADAARATLPSTQRSSDREQLVRERAVKALQDLSDYLETSDPANTAAWKAWLGWDGLTAAVNGDAADRSVVLDFEKKLRQNVKGLEHEKFRRLHRELKSLAAHVELATANDPEELHHTRLSEAKRLAENLGETPNHADADECAQLLDWLREIDGGDIALTNEVRTRFANPNGLAQVSARFLNYLAQRTIENSQPFTTTSMGANSSGTANTRASAGIRFTPNASAAAINLSLEGTVSMPNTVSTRRRVSVFSSAEVAIRAQKQVMLDKKGLRFAPATATADADVAINDVAAPRLIERLAWRQATRMRPEAAADTSRRVADEIESEADELSSELLSAAHRILCDEIIAPLVRRDAMPERLEFSTTLEHLSFLFLQRNTAQLGAGKPAAQFAKSDDVAARVHESFINNLAASVLPGHTVTDRQWLELLNLMTGHRPRGLWVHDRSIPWSVTFADTRPITARMIDGRLGITLRFDSVRWGDDRWTTPVTIEARFEPKIGRDGPAFIREGDVQIVVEAAESMPTEKSPADLRRMLSRKFSAVFPAELHFDGLVPPTGGALSKLRDLHLRDFYCQDGWLVIGYELVTGDAKVPDQLLTRSE
jgi:hypothetical protein